MNNNFLTGFDSYNLNATGDVGRTLATPSGGLNEHIPIVCCAYETMKQYTKVLCFKERAGCPGGGKGILVGEDKSFTLATNFNGAICYEREQSQLPESVGLRNKKNISD